MFYYLYDLIYTTLYSWDDLISTIRNSSLLFYLIYTYITILTILIIRAFDIYYIVSFIYDLISVFDIFTALLLYT